MIALRQRCRLLCQILLATLCQSMSPAWAQGLPSAVVTTPQVRAELVAHAPEGVQAGQPLKLGLLLQHQPGWHTYWLNPGDSGLATRLSWQLPNGLVAGPTVWPLPGMIQVANMVNHGFEGKVLLGSSIQVAPETAKAPTLALRLHAEWLVCKAECIPQSGEFLLTLPTRSSTAEHATDFEALWAQQPASLPDQSAELTPTALSWRVTGLPATVQGRNLKAYAQSPEVLASGLGLGPSTAQGQWHGDTWHMRAPLHAFRHSEPRELGLLLVDESSTQAWQMLLKIQGDWPSVQTSSPIALASQPLANTPSPASPLTLFGAVMGAMLGGLLLNLMPCVLPVLAIKLLSLSQPAVTPAMRRGIGVAYTAGVLLSMLGLALLVMGMRAAGQQLGWGFQLQSPPVIIGLAVLFSLIALNLFGVAQIRGAWASGLAAQLARHPLADAWLSGVLAVVVAAPCTAPFMGASVGLAFTLPAWQGVLIFISLGSGLALPFLLACWWPALANALPRPGAWMVVLRQALGFPMLATVVWLLWVLGQQTSIDASAVLLAVLVVFAGLVWAWGLTHHARTWTTAVFALALAGLLWVWGPVLTRVDAPASDSALAADSSAWQAWSPARVEQARQNGQPVFIDFTAAWCVTCQVNKQTTLRDPQVLQAFAAKKVLLLRADWTRQDPSISQALAALGRSGVPVYVLQAPGKEPELLSELLSPMLVLAALDHL